MDSSLTVAELNTVHAAGRAPTSFSGCQDARQTRITASQARLGHTTAPVACLPSLRKRGLSNDTDLGGNTGALSPRAGHGSEVGLVISPPRGRCAPVRKQTITFAVLSAADSVRLNPRWPAMARSGWFVWRWCREWWLTPSRATEIVEPAAAGLCRADARLGRGSSPTPRRETPSSICMRLAVHRRRPPVVCGAGIDRAEYGGRLAADVLLAVVTYLTLVTMHGAYPARKSER